LRPSKIQKEVYEAENPGEEYYPSNYEETAQGIGDIEKYRKSIFYSIIFRDDDGDPIFEPPRLSEAYLIFSPKIIEDNAKHIMGFDEKSLPVFCNGWSYGKIKPEASKYYDTSLNLEENMKAWRSMLQSDIDKYHKVYKNSKESINSNNILLEEKLIQVESGTLVSELLLEGEMPIDLDLIYIYVSEEPEELRIKMNQMYIKIGKEYVVEVREKQRQELEQLILDHPELPWIRKNPFTQK
jgi:hypothetical protein